MERLGYLLPAVIAMPAVWTMLGGDAPGRHADPVEVVATDSPAVVYRTVWETEYQERRYQVTRPVWEPVHREEKVTVQREVWETVEQEETYIDRRPVVEVVMQEESYVTIEPVTTQVTQYVDQGQWIDQQVQAPGRSVTRLRWVPGGWTVDPQTGVKYWKLGMIRPVREERLGPVQTYRIWQPNVTPVQVPQVEWQPTTQTRQVPVETVRYVEEPQVRKVPVQVCRTVEEEIVRPVTEMVCRWVTEERVEQVPVHVCRVVAVPADQAFATPERSDAYGHPMEQNPVPQHEPATEPPVLPPGQHVPQGRPQPTFRPAPSPLEQRDLVAMREP